MKISDQGIALIKRFEGLRLKAYKPVPSEKYYTIGYGHYGKDVNADMAITEAQAEAYLRRDLLTAEKAVNGLSITRLMTQGQYDALVSFTFNCGSANLRTLTNGRSLNTIGEKLILYNKAGGKKLEGLVRRRKAEQDLFFGRV